MAFPYWCHHRLFCVGKVQQISVTLILHDLLYTERTYTDQVWRRSYIDPSAAHRRFRWLVGSSSHTYNKSRLLGLEAHSRWNVHWLVVSSPRKKNNGIFSLAAAERKRVWGVAICHSLLKRWKNLSVAIENRVSKLKDRITKVQKKVIFFSFFSSDFFFSGVKKIHFVLVSAEFTKHNCTSFPTRERERKDGEKDFMWKEGYKYACLGDGRRMDRPKKWLDVKKNFALIRSKSFSFLLLYVVFFLSCDSRKSPDWVSESRVTLARRRFSSDDHEVLSYKKIGKRRTKVNEAKDASFVEHRRGVICQNKRERKKMTHSKTRVRHLLLIDSLVGPSPWLELIELLHLRGRQKTTIFCCPLVIVAKAKIDTYRYPTFNSFTIMSFVSL